MSFAKRRDKSRLIAGLFIPLPLVVLRSPNFASLKPNSVKLFCALLAQICPAKGNTAQNNGDLCVAPSILKQYGLKNQHTITDAKNELIEKGWIEMTKAGGLHMGPTLYAFTLWPIEECNGKLDVQPTRTPSNAWRTTPFDTKTAQGRKKRPCTHSKMGK